VRSLELIVFLPLSTLHIHAALWCSRSAPALILPWWIYCLQINPLHSCCWHTPQLATLYLNLRAIWLCSQRNQHALYKPKARFSSWNRSKEYFVVISDSLQAKTQKNWRVELIVMSVAWWWCVHLSSSYIFMKSLVRFIVIVGLSVSTGMLDVGATLYGARWDTFIGG